MKYTEQLDEWINDTVQYYLYKMRPKHWFSGSVVNVILHQDDMELLEEGWNEWAEEQGYESDEPISYDGDNIDLELSGQIRWRFEPLEQEYFILMWLDLGFHNNLAELQHTIVHELVHLNYPNIEHGIVFDKIIDIYLQGSFSGFWQFHNYFKSKLEKQRRITEYISFS